MISHEIENATKFFTVYLMILISIFLVRTLDLEFRKKKRSREKMLFLDFCL